MKKFILIGVLAHSNPKKDVEFEEEVFAKDILDAMDIYKKKFRGIKKKKLFEIREIT